MWYVAIKLIAFGEYPASIYQSGNTCGLLKAKDNKV